MEEQTDESWKEALRAYVLNHGDNLDFTRHFWKWCEPSEKDVVQYSKFCSTLWFVNQGCNNREVSEQVEASMSTVNTWRNASQLPKLAHYLKSYLQLGAPIEGCRWLTMECSHGYAVPIGKFLSVPCEVKSWQEVAFVLTQLPSLDERCKGYPREYLFGFLVGILMGDAAKTKSKMGSAHRHIGLVLSQKYETNILIGEFAALCARSIGLRMHRTEDLLKTANKPNGFFEWVSQASPLIDWLYNVALGLRDDELTTYNPVRADWMLLAPRDFRIGLIQGIAESDGSVNVASQIVEFWVDPHRDLLRRVLAMEGLRAFNNRQALSLSKTQAINSFAVPIFNPYLKTVRYKRHEMMATARRLGREDRLPEDLREEIMKLRSQGFSVPEIIGKIVETRKVLVSFEAAQRWARKATSVESSAQNGEHREGHG
jgi:hypothetical protein